MTLVNAYLMPQIDDILDQVGQARYISTLDLAKSYWQVPVAEEDRPKTAFVTPQGLYQFKMMSLGLCGAPTTFQQIIDQVIRGIQKFLGPTWTTLSYSVARPFVTFKSCTKPITGVRADN